MNANKSFYRKLEGLFNDSPNEKVVIAKRLQAKNQSELPMTVDYDVDQVIALMRKGLSAGFLSDLISPMLDYVANRAAGDCGNVFRKLSPGVAFRPAPLPLLLQSTLDNFNVGSTANYAAPNGQNSTIDALRLLEGSLVGDEEAYLNKGIYVTEGGGTNGIYTALEFLRATVEVGEVLVCGPGYFQFFEGADKLKARAVINSKVDCENSGVVDFLPTVDQLEAEVGDTTRALIITQPNNPTGEFYSRSELKKIIQMAIDAGLVIIEDAAFEELVLPEFREDFVSVAKVAREMEALDTVITIKSFSKGKNLPGLRVGYLATTNPKMINFMADNLVQQRDCPANVNSGLIRLDAYARLQNMGVDCKNCFEDLPFAQPDFAKVYDLQRSMDMQCYEDNLNFLQGVPEIFKARSNVRAAYNGMFLLNDGVDKLYDFARYVYEKYGVETQWGPNFDNCTERWDTKLGPWLRITFSTNPAYLKNSLERVQSALSTY